MAGATVAFNNIASDKSIIAGQIDLSGFTSVSVDPGIITFKNIKFSLVTGADLTVINPFLLGNTLTFTCSIDLHIPGYAPLNSITIKVALDMGTAVSIPSLFTGLVPVPGNGGSFPLLDVGVVNGAGHRFQGTLQLNKSEQTKALALSNDLLVQLLSASSFLFQYAEGVIVTKVNGKGAGALNVGTTVITPPAPKQIDISCQPSFLSDDTKLLLDIAFTDRTVTSPPTNAPALAQLLSNPSKVALNFPAGYHAPPITAVLR
jgi:hypothetical protein